MGDRYIPASINSLPLPPSANEHFKCHHYGKCSTRQVLKILFWAQQVEKLFSKDDIIVTSTDAATDYDDDEEDWDDLSEGEILDDETDSISSFDYIPLLNSPNC